MSRTITRLAALTAVLFAVTGCGLIKEGAEAISATTTVPGQTPGPVDTGNATSVACLNELQIVELAVTSYELLEGVKPTTETEMIPKYLRAESKLFDISPTGDVVPTPGSGC